MRLERRRPRLHECEARKGSRDLRPAKFDVAGKRDVAGEDACVPVASAFTCIRIRLFGFAEPTRYRRWY
jgi:hypothetical protein